LAFANVIGSINPNGFSGLWGPFNYAANPSFEEDAVGSAPALWNTTNFTGNGVNNGGSITVVTPGQTGNNAGQIVTTNALTSEGASLQVIPAGYYQPGWTFSASMWMKGNAGGELVSLLLGNTAFYAGGQTNVTLTTSWQQVTVQFTAPAGSGSQPLTLTSRTNSAAAYTWFIDACEVTLSNTVPTVYFDGDQSGYGWTGTAGQSRSQSKGTWYWFQYGTSLPLGGTATATQFLANGLTVPQTVTLNLTGLTVGATYYVQLMGQNGAGLVHGNTIPFMANVPPVPASQPIVPPGQPSFTIPHFQVPFQLVTTGNRAGAVVVEQDTLEEIVSCVNTIVECPIGACPQLPTFGIPQPTFAQAPISTTELVAAIQTLEPRATEDAVSTLMPDGTSWGIQLNTSAKAAQDV
jgi:hypothetical protein